MTVEQLITMLTAQGYNAAQIRAYLDGLRNFVPGATTNKIPGTGL